MKNRKGRRTKTKDTQRTSSATQSDLLRRSLDWVINEKIFAGIHQHGNTKWLPKYLVVLAVLTAWSGEQRLTDAFDKARRLSQNMFGQLAIRTFQGMMRALVSATPQLLPLLWSRLQELMQQAGGRHYRIGGWLPLAVDGSRFSTPRSKSNEEAFSAKTFGKGKKAKSRSSWKNRKQRIRKPSAPVRPQIWMTLVWHMGLKLPWCWKTGPSTSSERHHLMEMLDSHSFPENTLFCCDAGFVGYEFWNSILDAGHSFVVRVGGNVRLLRNLGHVRTSNDIVCFWPSAVARRKQPPLVLRLVEVKSSKGSMWLVTNVLRERDLSTFRLKSLYLLRWGIEVQFRSTKQTFGRSQLRSRNSDHALAELDWSMIALTMVQLFAAREQIQLDEPPARASVSAAIRAVRFAIQNWHEPARAADNLTSRLQAATNDDYKRKSSKTSRFRSKKHDPPRATAPIITKATRNQKQKCRALKLAC